MRSTVAGNTAGSDGGGPNADRLRAAKTLASDADGLRLALATTIADRYEVHVPDADSEIRLRRRA